LVARGALPNLSGSALVTPPTGAPAHAEAEAWGNELPRSIARPGFDAEVREDGTLIIRDRPSNSIDLHAPCSRCREKLSSWVRDPSSADAIGLGDLLPFDVRVDITDPIMRAGGQDPYLADKLRLADSTRPARQAMAARARAETSIAALRGLRPRLEALWARTELSARERRWLLFLLWDECDDTSHGSTARATIIGFIRRRHIAYPRAELEEFNRRRSSRQEFSIESEVER
jgi:hypothetical protein